MDLTAQQKLIIAIGIVGAATSAFGALNPIMTSTEALVGTVILGFISACLAVVGTVISSQGAQIKSVAAMPGIEPLKVNANANQVVAQLAMDPKQDKIAPMPESEQQVNQIAKGN